MREVAIVAAFRTPAGRAKKGNLKDTRPDDLAALVIKKLLDQTGIDPEVIDDVVLGCAFPENEQGMNVARIAALKAGISYKTPAMTVNRFCSSGLQAISQAAQNIMLGGSDVAVAGGVESMTMIPMGGSKPSPNPGLMDDYPEAYTSMGITAEIVAEKFKISRAAQDEFAAKSHQKAAKAIKDGKFKDEIVPVETRVRLNGEWKDVTVDTDECVRPDTTAEGLARLRPVFDMKGTVTAGNASPINDGAAAVLLMTKEKANELGLKPLLWYRDYTVAGVPPEIMGIGPAVAVPKLLEKAGMSLDQIDLIEINEAFAAQSIYCVDELKLDEAKTNVNGGAIALGHPLGCTGAKLTVSLVHEMLRRPDAKFGMVTMCIGGGMGAAGLFEKA